MTATTLEQVTQALHAGAVGVVLEDVDRTELFEGRRLGANAQRDPIRRPATT
jgi:hypothetical protein